VSEPGVGELTGANPVDRGNPESKYHERRADIVTALLHLGCALICARKLQPL
jgi:hypothetical protein